MKTIHWYAICLLILFTLAACTPPANPVSVTRPVTLVGTAVLPTPTSSENLVEVTSVIGTTEPAATPTATEEATINLPPAAELRNPVSTADSIISGSWSPDGRFLAYSAEMTEPTIGLYLQNIVFYDPIQAQSCPFGDYGLALSSRGKGYFWLPDGTLFVHGEGVVAIVEPCGALVANLTDRFPGDIQYEALAPDRTVFLLSIGTELWLYRFADQQLTAVTGSGPAVEDGIAFSPDGRFVAFNDKAGGSYLLDVATATIGLLATWEAPLGLGGQAHPQWINNTQFVIRNSNDLGSLLINVDGAVQNAGLAFFGESAPIDSGLFAFRDDENGRFHLLLQTFSNDTDALRLFHSETGGVETIALPGYRWADGTSNKDPHWFFIYATNEAGDEELLIRPVDPPGSIPQPMPLYSQAGFTGLQLTEDHLALGVGNRMDVFNLPDLSIVASYTAVDQTVSVRSISPDGRFLAIITTHPEGTQSLFIQPVTLPEANNTFATYAKPNGPDF